MDLERAELTLDLKVDALSERAFDRRVAPVELESPVIHGLIGGECAEIELQLQPEVDPRDVANTERATRASSRAQRLHGLSGLSRRHVMERARTHLTAAARRKGASWGQAAN